MPYHWRQHHGTFAAAFIIARHISLDLHDAEAPRCAVEGWDEPVFYKGQICGHVRRYSDTLLLARLKVLDPETYRERWEGPLAGPAGGPVQAAAAQGDLSRLSDEQLKL